MVIYLALLKAGEINKSLPDYCILKLRPHFVKKNYLLNTYFLIYNTILYVTFNLENTNLF